MKMIEKEFPAGKIPAGSGKVFVFFGRLFWFKSRDKNFKNNYGHNKKFCLIETPPENTIIKGRGPCLRASWRHGGAITVLGAVTVNEAAAGAHLKGSRWMQGRPDKVNP
jgi:hypothetical protein